MYGSWQIRTATRCSDCGESRLAAAGAADGEPCRALVRDLCEHKLRRQPSGKIGQRRLSARGDDDVDRSTLKCDQPDTDPLSEGERLSRQRRRQHQPRLALAAAGLALASCNDAQDEPKTASPPERLNDENELRSAWPFTVASGRIACQRQQGLAVVTFEFDGTLYAVNAAARMRGYAQLRRIWALDTRTGRMKDVSPVAEFGRGLCRDG